MIRIITCFASIARESDRGFKIPTIMNKAEYHIYLVTTKGCKGCEIRERIIKQALYIIEANIHLHISDYTKFKHTNPEYDKFKDFVVNYLKDKQFDQCIEEKAGASR